MATLVRQDNPTYRCTTGFVELEQVVNQQRFLPDEYLDAKQSMVTQAFCNYALPLLGDPLLTKAQTDQSAVAACQCL